MELRQAFPFGVICYCMNTYHESTQKVTVILPVYNGSAYLSEAIDSVLAQDCYDWKLLIVDDGSADKSSAIVTNYTDERISFRKNSKNLGLYGSLNRAVQEVDTEYLVILMQDDLLKINHISSLLHYAQQNDECVSIWGDNDTIDSHGIYLSRGRNQGTLDYCTPSRRAWLETFSRGCYWIISGSLIKTSWVRVHPFRTDLPHAADLEFLITTIKLKPMLYVASTFSTVRIHSGQQTNAHARDARDLREYLIILREQAREGMTKAEWLPLHVTLQVSILRRVASRIMRKDFSAAYKALALLGESFLLQ